ncbi:MAG: hypothetical protein R2720_12425 [Candidatus Nanopelagicales bacterium]
MNRIVGLSATTLAATLVTSGALAPPAASAVSNTKDNVSSRAVGTWRMMVDPRPVQGPNGTIDVPAFPSLVTLHEGGTITDAVSSLAGAASALLGADAYTNGAGVWSASKKSIRFRFQRFFTKDGAYVGSQVVAGTGRMKGKKTVQVATATFYDTTGKIVGIPVTIDAVGTRMKP